MTMAETKNFSCPCDLAAFCSERTDQEIIDFVRQNKECYQFLVKRYEAKLTRYVRRISNVPKESVEDILQTVFLKTYMNLNTFDRGTEFSPWIYRITHNETINYWRKNKKQDMVFSIDDKDFLKNIVSDGRSVEKQVTQKLDSQKISEAIARLSSKHRQVLALRYKEELSYQEISEILKKPIGTVGTLINRGKKVLQEQLAKMGYSASSL